MLEQTIDFIHELANTSKSDNTAIEIELKLLLDERINVPYFINRCKKDNPRESIIQIISNFKQYGIPSLSRTINFINTKPDSMFVKQLGYTNGVQDPSLKKFYSKKSIIKSMYLVSDNFASKFSINEETAEIEDINMFDIVRFRLRYSILFTKPELSDWRLDVTIIKETRDNSISLLKKIKDKLFTPDINVDNFIDNIGGYSDRIEVELEYVGKIADFTIEKMASVMSFILPNKINTGQKSYTECICDIAKILKPNMISKFKQGHYGLKQLGVSPVELTKKNYRDEILPNIDNFIVTEKIDGIRSMLIIYPKQKICYIISNKDESGIELKNIQCDCNEERIILDTEAYEIDNETRYYVFDIIEYQTRDPDIHSKPFSQRIKAFSGIIDSFKLENGAKLLYNKNFIELDKINYGTQIKDFYEMVSQKEYKIDGLIFISQTTDYNAKWKPLMTIDFVAKSCPSKMLGISPYIVKPNKKLYLLFCGIRSFEYKKLGIEKFRIYDQIFNNICINRYGKTNDSYIPIQFSPSSDPYAYLFWSEHDLHDKVVELIYHNEWELFKIRDDRVNDVKRKTYYGNYFKYAENIWMNYKNPLSLDILTSDVQQSRYFKQSDDKYLIIRKFNNYVKKQLIDINAAQVDLNWVIDLAAGQGQDLNKYIERGFKNILLIDIDKDALAEVVNRKYLYIANDRIKNNSKIFIKNMNLSNPYKTNLDLIRDTFYTIPSEGSQFITCNFALHYIAANKKNIQNFVQLLNKLLAPGGIFIFTAFNGQKIFNLLEHITEWHKYDASGNLIYSIKKKYNDNSFTGHNQNIDVLLPFSDGKYYTESLINTDILNAELEKKKIDLIAESSFYIYLEKFGIDKPHFNKLTDGDIEFISLYNFYVYHKKINRRRV